jgi:hypothetical protein
LLLLLCSLAPKFFVFFFPLVPLIIDVFSYVFALVLLFINIFM